MIVYANTLLLDSTAKLNINNIHLAAIYVGIGNTGMEEGHEVNPDKWKKYPPNTVVGMQYPGIVFCCSHFKY